MRGHHQCILWVALLLPLAVSSARATAADREREARFDDEAALIPDIGGLWQGPEWGILVLRSTKPGTYEGKFTEVGTSGPGTLSAKWSPERRRFEGEWREGKDQRGGVTFAPREGVNDTIDGSWTIEEPQGVVDPPFGDLKWTRGGKLHLRGLQIADEVLDIFAGQKIDVLKISAVNISDRGLGKLARAAECRELQLAPQVCGPGMAALKEVRGLSSLVLPAGVSEDVCADLVDLQDLQTLRLFRVRLTSDGLEQIAKLTKLKHLQLPGCFITDSGLAHLAPLAELAELDLSDTRIHDAGLAQLTAFPHLKELNLSRSTIADDNITGAGMRHLAALSELESLDLTGTAIDDAGIAQLANLQHLKEVRLLETPTSPAAVQTLAEMPEIELLALSESQVRAGLAALQKMKNLKRLQIRLGPKPNDRDELQRALPHCQISYIRRVSRL